MFILDILILVGVVYLITRNTTGSTSMEPMEPMEPAEESKFIPPAKSYPPKSDEEAYIAEILAHKRESAWKNKRN